jgi:3D (Asp-Asp-Asp) domain-containing protein
LKLVGIKEFYNITRAKILSAVSCSIVVFVCATATFIVDSTIDFTNVQAQPIETELTITVVSYPDGFDPDNPDNSADVSTEDTSDTEDTSEVTSEETSDTEETSESSESSETSASEGSTETSATSESTSESTKATTKATTKTTTKATTKATSSSITETEKIYGAYAKTTINVRKGPGTNYDIVKTINAGAKIDVVAETSNGWVKTANNNYIKKSLISETKPSATPTPVPKKNTPTPKPTAKPTTKPTSATTKSSKAPVGEKIRCKITFYGPVKMKNGTYSTTTATGTKCKQGRTCGADWKVFPAGTVVYIENDPLGDDGYYTVEDTGPGAKGYHLDLFADDGENTSKYSTMYRDVIVQKK